MKVLIKAEITEEVFNQIPNEIKDQIKIRLIEATDYKELYKQSKEWKDANKMLSEAIKHRDSIQDEIRANIKAIN